MGTRDKVRLNGASDVPNMALVDEGKGLGIDVLRHAVATEGWDAVEGMLVVAHKDFPLADEKSSSVRRVPGRPWSIGFWERFEGFVGDRYVIVAPELAMLSVFVAGGGCTFGIGPEELLPLARSDAPTRDSRILPLLWAIYCDDPNDLDAESASLVRGLHRRVREAARVELAVPGSHRSERELLYDLVNGAKLDRLVDVPAIDIGEALIRELVKAVTRRG